MPGRGVIDNGYHHSLQLTAASHGGFGHVSWRARNPQALARRVAAIEAGGRGRGWIDAGPGHGRAIRFETPEGHPMELFWEVDYAATPAGQDTALHNRPQRRPRAGVQARRIDHLNLMTADTVAVRDFMIDALGFRERERVEVDGGGPVIASWLSLTNLTHDIALIPEPTPARRRRSLASTRGGRYWTAMLSYQHAYHAGNAADVHKHAVLAELLARLTAKPRGVSYAETHAGRGRYDLAAAEALKTGDAAEGIGRITLDPATPYGRALAVARAAYGPLAYPGSPLIARALLRPQDRMTLLELHPAEHAALRAATPPDGLAIHRRDGFEGLLALAPLKPRRGLVLVDPSYEVKSDYAAAADFVRRLVAKWPEATVLVWHPILPAGRHAELIAGLGPLPVLTDEVRFARPPGRGMTGSGLALVNPPHGAAAAFAAARAQGAAVFA